LRGLLGHLNVARNQDLYAFATISKYLKENKII